MTDFAIKETKQEAELRAKQVPEPKGWKILCMVPKVDSIWANSKLAKPDETIKVEMQTSTVLYVAKMGDLCYKDPVKFPTGAWCKEGDFVIVRAYTGTRLLIHGTEWRIINDDSVEGIVDDPRGIGRP